MRIIGFDPGETTGYVDVRLHDDYLHVEDVREIPFVDRFNIVELIYGMQEQYVYAMSPPVPLPDIVVVESFRLYAHAAHHQAWSHFPSVLVIGVIDTYLHMHELNPRTKLQPASVIAGVKVPDEYASHFKGFGEHARDAFRHVRYYWIMNLRERR